MSSEELATLSRLKEEVEKRLYAEAAVLAETALREGLQKRVDVLQLDLEETSAVRARLSHENALLASDVDRAIAESNQAKIQAENAGKSRNEAHRLLEEEKNAVVVLGNAIRILNDRVALAEERVQDVLKKAGDLVSCAKCGEIRGKHHTKCFLCGSSGVV